jgi:F420-non-reducing hydrogenase large subunit
MSQRIRIDPVTRLEGHGRIEIFLDEAGDVSNAYFQVPELRGFERFCVGRAAEEMPVITSRVCGICPEAHQLAACKALDQVFSAPPPRPALLLRQLLYCAFFVADHITHFYALGGPDLLIGPDSPPARRNLLGVIAKLGPETGQRVLATRARNHQVIEWLGGRAVHATGGLAGGWSISLSEERRTLIEQFARENISFALASLRLLTEQVLQQSGFDELFFGDTYVHKTYSMGSVDGLNRLHHYDGDLRVIDPEGCEVLRFPAARYQDHIAEHVESWTYLKFPYLKAVGWKGFEDGPLSGVYTASPLARLNVSDSLATPLAQEEYERFYAAYGSKKVNGRFRPVHHRMANHWARLIEVVYASERMLELALDAEVTSPEVRAQSGAITGEGVGCIEAPRGTLIHHYQTDERGLLTRVNLIAGTTHNHAAIAMSIRKAAEAFIQKGRVVEEGMLNRIEMALRLYDPCLACATHSQPGSMPLLVNVRGPDGALQRTFSRDAGRS